MTLSKAEWEALRLVMKEQVNIKKAVYEIRSMMEKGELAKIKSLERQIDMWDDNDKEQQQEISKLRADLRLSHEQKNLLIIEIKALGAKA